jgi:hypothetical protein
MADDVKIVVSAVDNATATLRRIQGEMSGFATGAKAFAGAIAGSFAFQQVSQLMTDSLKEYAKAESAQIKLQTVLKATGNTTRLSMKEILDFAQGIQDATGTEAESILGAAAQLSRFRDIAGPQFKEVITLAHDMAKVLGTDVESATVQLAKALSSPAEGMSKLARSGVMFTEVQKEMIKGLEETGRHAEAQAEILKEIRRQFGGAGEAFGDSVAGQIDKLTVAIGDLKEELGQTLVPAIQSITEILKMARGGSATGELGLRPMPAGLNGVQQNQFLRGEIDRLQKEMAEQEKAAIASQTKRAFATAGGSAFGVLGAMLGFSSVPHDTESLESVKRSIAQARKAIDLQAELREQQTRGSTILPDLQSGAAALFGGLRAGINSNIKGFTQGQNIGGVQLPSTADAVNAVFRNQVNKLLGPWSPFADGQEAAKAQGAGGQLPNLNATEARFLMRGRGTMDPAVKAAEKQVAGLNRIETILRRMEDNGTILGLEAIA